MGLRHTQSLPSVPSGCIISTWARVMRAGPQACHLHTPFAPEFSTQQPLVVKIEGGQKQYLQLIWTAALVTRITALSCRHGRPALFVGPERMLSKIYVFLAVELYSKSALLLWKVKVPILTSCLSPFFPCPPTSWHLLQRTGDFPHVSIWGNKIGGFSGAQRSAPGPPLCQCLPNDALTPSSDLGLNLSFSPHTCS